MHDRTSPARSAGRARKRGAALLAAMLLAGGLPVRAVNVGPQQLHPVAAAPLSLPAAVRRLPAVAPPAAAPAPLGDASLEQLRGGTETPWSDMRLSGTVGNNTAVNVVTGANHITDGAFSNSSGLPMVIQNSGSNVLIQNATIVNVRIQ